MKLSSDKEHLVLDNQKLVHHLVKKLGVTPNSSEYEDIVSIGMIGLIKASITFDSSKEIAFSTYASRCIKNEIFMHYRKARKYESDISIDEIIAEDKEGKELTLRHMIEDPESNFVERIVNKEVFIQLVNIVLNCLREKYRLVMLYRMAGISQENTSEILHISRSYVSRIEQKATQEIRETANNQVQYEEVFSMSIVGDEYRISFLCKDIRKFNKIFATLLQNLTSTEKLPDFKVNCNRERILIQIPAHPESFSFIAQIIQEIDDFSMTFVSDKSTSYADNTIMQKVKPNELNKRDDAIGESQSTEVVQFNSVKSCTVDEKDEKFTAKRGSQIKQVREYMLTMSSFTVNDLKHHFPNMTDVTINNAVYLAKSKGLITSTGKGKYVVNKT